MVLDINEILSFIKAYGEVVVYAALIIGLVFFITYGVMKNHTNYVTRGFVYILVGGILLILFVTATIIDYTQKIEANLGLFSYLLFIIVTFIYTLTLGLTNIIIGKRSYQRLSFKKVKPSINRNIAQHIYVVYKCGSKVILKKGKETASGFSAELDKSHLFKDERLIELNKKYHLNMLEDEFNEAGIVTVNGKKINLYYCYLIEISNITDALASEIVVDQYDLVTLPMTDFDKEIVLRILMREPFKLYY